MTASTQTTSAGWFYAESAPATRTAAWDGSMWPEVTGYRGHALPDVAHAGRFEENLSDAAGGDESLTAIADLAGLAGNAARLYLLLAVIFLVTALTLGAFL